MNGCKNKSSFFESKGARGGDQAAGPGVDAERDTDAQTKVGAVGW